jgi:hypothetical protein
MGFFVIATGSSFQDSQIVWNEEVTGRRIPQYPPKFENKNKGLQLGHSFAIVGDMRFMGLIGVGGIQLPGTLTFS